MNAKGICLLDMTHAKSIIPDLCRFDLALKS